MSSSYLEHFLGSLEHLPGEVRRNFTLMHDLDTRNKNILQEVDLVSDEYLRKVGDLNAEKKRAEMEKIRGMFKKAKGFGDEKVSIALQTYEMVDKHIRRLDADLAKFEAEMREKGKLSQTESEESDQEDEEQQPEGKKRGRKKTSASAATASASNKDSVASSTAKKKKKKAEKGKDAAVEEKGKKKSRKTAGQKAEPAAEAQRLPSVTQEIIDMPVDPNEPTYCLCQQVSYGEMIGCDNNDCPIEWFHFGCMSLTTKPKGKWYCPKCQVLIKKKKGA